MKVAEFRFGLVYERSNAFMARWRSAAGIRRLGQHYCSLFSLNEYRRFMGFVRLALAAECSYSFHWTPFKVKS